MGWMLDISPTFFGLRRHPYYEQSRKGVTAIQLAPMTGRKAGLLWKATVDEKESGWLAGVGGMAFSFSFVFFCGTCPLHLLREDAWSGRCFISYFFSLAACERS